MVRLQNTLNQLRNTAQRWFHGPRRRKPSSDLAITAVQDANLAITGAIGGDKKLTKAGDGTLVLGSLTRNPVNDYTGGTEITGGILEIASPDALPVAQPLSITAGTGVLNCGLSQAVKVSGLRLSLPTHAAGSVRVGAPQAVPEPGSAALAGMAALLITLFKSQRRQRGIAAP